MIIFLHIGANAENVMKKGGARKRDSKYICTHREASWLYRVTVWLYQVVFSLKLYLRA